MKKTKEELDPLSTWLTETINKVQALFGNHPIPDDPDFLARVLVTIASDKHGEQFVRDNAEELITKWEELREEEREEREARQLKAGEEMKASWATHPTMINLTTSKTTVASGETFRLSGYLTDAHRNPLAGQDIVLYWHEKPPLWKIATTNSTGYYFLDVHESATTMHLYARFLGDSTYAPSQSNGVTVTIS
jgi:hypothetical protein